MKHYGRTQARWAAYWARQGYADPRLSVLMGERMSETASETDAVCGIPVPNAESQSPVQVCPFLPAARRSPATPGRVEQLAYRQRG